MCTDPPHSGGSVAVRVTGAIVAEQVPCSGAAMAMTTSKRTAKRATSSTDAPRARALDSRAGASSSASVGRGPDAGPDQGGANAVGRNWTFLSNHAHVLFCVAEAPDIRLRDIATRVGITERAASSIVADLERDGYLTREKVGRNNHYKLHRGLPLRHPIEQHRRIGDLLAALIEE
jgi:hypothetical protein